MTIKTQSSRIFLINLFADFIISKIPHEEQSIINIVDCKNFILVKGKTTSKNLLNLSQISNEFSSKFSEYLNDNKITHTLDLIEYDQHIIPLEELSHTYHNTDNCSYHYKQIEHFNEKNTSCYYDYSIKEVDDSNLLICSEFPHGYSLGQGRLLYYYGKHIFYNIPPSYPITTITFKLSIKKDKENSPIFLVYNNSLESEDETIQSWALDNFDFDMSSLSTEIKKVDWSVELTNPLSEYDFLKKRNGDFLII
jgi:hypothetical protein